MWRFVSEPANPCAGISVKVGKKWHSANAEAIIPFCGEEEGRTMAEQDRASLAFERAWSVYLLINREVDENDERRAILDRFIRQRCEAGQRDVETLTVEGITYLKKLDESARFSSVQEDTP
jgi:hypothetical protein